MKVNQQKVNQQKINLNVNSLAEQYQLGKLIGSFHWERGEIRNLLILGIGLTIAGFPILVFMLPSLLTNPNQQIAFWVLAVCYVVTQISSLWLMLDALKRLQKKWAVALFEQGLIDHQGKRPIAILYADVNYFWTDIIARYQRDRFIGLSYVYTLEKNDRTKVTFNDELYNVEQLGKIVRDRVLDQQIPKAMTAYLQGEVIQFGDITLTQDGIAQGERSASWIELDEIQIKQGFVTLSKHQSATNIAFLKVADFPNLDLFLTIVNWVKQGQQQDVA